MPKILSRAKASAKKPRFSIAAVYTWSVTLLLVVLLVLVGAGKLTVIGYTANTVTQSYGVQGWSGGGNPAYTATAGVNTNGGLLDQTDYMASWAPNGNGLTVNAQASVYFPTASLCNPVTNWGYLFLLFVPGSTPISGWNVINPGTGGFMIPGGPQDYPSVDKIPVVGAAGSPAMLFTEPVPGGPTRPNGAWVSAPSVPWMISSPDDLTVISEGSVVKVRFYIYFQPTPTCPGGPGNGWYGVTEDDARIHTGVGTVYFSPRMATIGQTVSCSWQVGYVPSQPGTFWTVFITSTGRANATVAGPQTISSLSGAITYTVTAADIVGPPAGPGELYCDLRNNLVPKDFDDIAAVDAGCYQYPPYLAVQGISPATPTQGQMITVNWSIAPNSISNARITSIRVRWGWGSPSTIVSLPGSVTSYTFAASQAGYVTIVVYAVDANGCASTNNYGAAVGPGAGNGPGGGGSQKSIITVNPQPPNGGLGGGGPQSTFGIPLLVILILLALGAGILLGGVYLTKNPVFRVPFILVGGILSGVGFILGLLALISYVQSLLPH